MAKLTGLQKRWEIPLTVLEGGSGIVKGLLTEADQTQVPAYTFVNPRQILRTGRNTALREGMVIQTPGGTRFIVGQNGDSEVPEGTIWKSFRLYEATNQVEWKRRKMVVDPITKLQRDAGEDTVGLIWVAIEPLDREVPELKSRTSHEQDRFICGAPVQHDDILNGKKVIRADSVLGMILGVLTD